MYVKGTPTMYWVLIYSKTTADVNSKCWAPEHEQVYRGARQ